MSNELGHNDNFNARGFTGAAAGLAAAAGAALMVGVMRALPRTYLSRREERLRRELVTAAKLQFATARLELAGTDAAVMQRDLAHERETSAMLRLQLQRLTT